MSAGDCLIVRQADALWAIPRASVRAVTRGAGGAGRRAPVRIEVGGRTLRAAEVVGFAAELAVRPLGAVLRRFWPATALGMAVHEGRPLLVVDPGAPPASLCEEPTDV